MAIAREPFTRYDILVELCRDVDLQAKSVCMEILPGWDTVQVQDQKAEVISGGVTNFLLKVIPPIGSSLAPVVVRIFGANTEQIIDRERELQDVLLLNANGFGAQIIGVFGNGRIEEFLEGQTLEQEQLQQRDVQSRISHRIAEFHSLTPLLRGRGRHQCSLWPRLEHWMSVVRGLSFEDGAKQRALSMLDLDEYQREISELRQVSEGTGMPLVMSHNDLLPGNIILLPEGTLQFIDFEYGGVNYRGYDLGNHFNEFAGLECNYANYPSLSTQRHYAREYLERSGGGDAASEDDVTGLVLEANLCALSSHLLWGLWAVIQARYSTIDFDYIAYSRLRYQEYKRRKPAVLGMVRDRSPAAGHGDRR